MWNLQLMSFSAYTKQLAGDGPRSLPPAQGPCRGSWRRIVGFPTPSELSPVISQTDSSAKDPRALLPGSPCWPALPGVMRVGQLWGFLTSCVRLHTLLARAAGERGGSVRASSWMRQSGILSNGIRWVFCWEQVCFPFSVRQHTYLTHVQIQ